MPRVQSANRSLIPWVKTLLQIGVIAIAWFVTVFFCSRGEMGSGDFAIFQRWLLPLVAIRLAAIVLVTRARLQWRFASICNLVLTVEAVSLGSVVFLFGLVARRESPQTVVMVPLEWFISLNGLMGLQLAARGLWARLLSPRSETKRPPRRVLVIGAGDAGQRVVRSMQEDRQANLTPVGFLDDNPVTWGRLIHGIPVYGSIDLAPEVSEQRLIDQVLVAIPSLSVDGLREVIRKCAGVCVELTMLPRLDQLLGASPTARLIRKVDTADLLERPPVRLDIESISQYSTGERVLITGAGGSIGSELCRQIVRLKPSALALVGHGENSLFSIQQELKEDYGFDAKAILADVQDRRRLENVFRSFRPTVVFHAAAHKHVPLMEEHPAEAVKNNVVGTRNVAELAIAYRVRTFVMISTDKAVNPTSVMGATKRVAELVVQSLAQRISEAREEQIPVSLWGFDKVAPKAAVTRLAAVRFGNVLGSRGSVIPTMQRQIEKGGPVTVTHPNMVRFFMTIPEAVQLVLQAGAIGKGGEVFVLDMGHPVKILDLAENLIRLSGLVPRRDIDIRFTGIRPGEKMYEELLTSEEGTCVTHHERIFVAPARSIDHADLHHALERLVAAANADDNDAVRAILHEIIPGFHHPIVPTDARPVTEPGILNASGSSVAASLAAA